MLQIANANTSIVHSLEPGTFARQIGPSMESWTTWYDSVLELKTLEMLRLMSFRHWRLYRTS